MPLLSGLGERLRSRGASILGAGTARRGGRAARRGPATDRAEGSVLGRSDNGFPRLCAPPSAVVRLAPRNHRGADSRDCAAGAFLTAPRPRSSRTRPRAPRRSQGVSTSVPPFSRCRRRGRLARRSAPIGGGDQPRPWPCPLTSIVRSRVCHLMRHPLSRKRERNPARAKHANDAHLQVCATSTGVTEPPENVAHSNSLYP
jgi:hypothetical protein